MATSVGSFWHTMRQMLHALHKVARIVYDVLDQLLLLITLANVTDVGITIDCEGIILISNHNLFVARHVRFQFHITVRAHCADARQARLRRVEHTMPSKALLLYEYLIAASLLRRRRQHAIRCLMTVIIYGRLAEALCFPTDSL